MDLSAFRLVQSIAILFIAFLHRTGAPDRFSRDSGYGQRGPLLETERRRFWLFPSSEFLLGKTRIIQRALERAITSKVHPWSVCGGHIMVAHSCVVDLRISNVYC